MPTTRALAAAGVLGLTTLASTVIAAVPANAVSSDAMSYFNAINSEREAHGLPALTMRSDLDAVAQSWADHMASTGVLAHNPNLVSDISNWTTIGENVGEGPSIASLTQAFWNSPEHKANILDSSYRDVGVATKTVDGTIWITIDFRDPEYSESSPSVASPRAVSSSVSAVTHHRTLREGDTGSDVRAVQRKVHVSADGIFGPVTKRAVERFQRAHHLHADGVVGSATWKALHL
jgi:peptidoglycan hydrolase-like protein with peptidoglycan-binding domain